MQVDTQDSIRKQELLILAMEEDGIELVEQGNHYKCICPFHDDTNPSMVIFKDTHYYKCYACGVKGDVYDYLWHVRKMGYKEALKHFNMSHYVRQTIKRKPVLIEQIVAEEKTGIDVVKKYSAEFINHLLLQELERLANAKD